MSTGLFVIDLQRDFTEHVPGGVELTALVTEHLREHREEYGLVVASRDWHDAVGDNGGHFPPAPPGSADPYLRHCVAESRGAEYDPALAVDCVDVHVKKGQGQPGYSLFTGVRDDGRAFPEFLATTDVQTVRVVGLVTEFCVRAAALDALAAGYTVEVLSELIGSGNPQRAREALDELRAAGAAVL